jgi:hypothetical protein
MLPLLIYCVVYYTVVALCTCRSPQCAGAGCFVFAFACAGARGGPPTAEQIDIDRDREIAADARSRDDKR